MADLRLSLDVALGLLLGLYRRADAALSDRLPDLP